MYVCTSLVLLFALRGSHIGTASLTPISFNVIRFHIITYFSLINDGAMFHMLSVRCIAIINIYYFHTLRICSSNGKNLILRRFYGCILWIFSVDILLTLLKHKHWIMSDEMSYDCRWLLPLRHHTFSYIWQSWYFFNFNKNNLLQYKWAKSIKSKIIMYLHILRNG